MPEWSPRYGPLTAIVVLPAQSPLRHNHSPELEFVPRHPPFRRRRFELRQPFHSPGGRPLAQVSRPRFPVSLKLVCEVLNNIPGRRRLARTALRRVGLA
jgi:hypothetical protein